VLALRYMKKLIKTLHREMLAPIKEDGAHVLVLGCTGMMGVAKEAEKQFRRDGYDVSVIDPVVASLKFAESLVRTGVKRSRLTHMPPPKKARPGC